VTALSPQLNPEPPVEYPEGDLFEARTVEGPGVADGEDPR